VVKRTDFSQMRCSVARATEVMAERWVILLLREAYYGVMRFDEFQKHLGIAPNILSARLRKLVALGIFERASTSDHAGRFEYRLTEKGRDFFPAYLALKSWGDRWMADPAGPIVVFKERQTGRAIKAPDLVSSAGKPLTPEDVVVVPGPGAGKVTRRRFGPGVAAAAESADEGVARQRTQTRGEAKASHRAAAGRAHQRAGLRRRTVGTQ
jgi:DNA-binding HxlR family transcriptional regulator